MSISFRDNVTVLVTVGEEKAEFYVHKPLLCDGSHFFRTALTGGYKETTEGTYMIHVLLIAHASWLSWCFPYRHLRLSIKLLV